MMNDVATINGAVALPELSWGLQRAIDEYRRLEATGEAFRFHGEEVPQYVKDQASARLSALQAMDTPATLDDVLHWLSPIASSVSQPPPEDDYRNRAAAIQAVCVDVPGRAFSDATCLAAMRKFQWFPSSAEVRALLMEEMTEERRERRALKAIAMRRGGGAEPPRETQKVRDEMAAKLRGVAAEVEARATEAEMAPEAPAPIKSRPLSPEHLRQIRAENPLIRATWKMREVMR